MLRLSSNISTFLLTLSSSVKISAILLNTGTGLFLAVLFFKNPILGPNAFSIRSVSSDIILLFLIRFILITALRSLAVGVPKA